MELPISYMIFLTMKILKTHKMDTRLSNRTIADIVADFIEDYYPEERGLFEYLDINEEIYMTINNYPCFYGDESGNIILHKNIRIENLEEYMEDSKSYFDNELLEEVDEYFDFNVALLESLGIEMNDKLYIYLANLQIDIEREYRTIAEIEASGKIVTDKDIHKLKLMSIKRNLIYSYMKNTFDLQEYEDMTNYCKYFLQAINDIKTGFGKENEKRGKIRTDDTFYRALFFIDDNSNYNLYNKFNIMVNKTSKDKMNEKFYTKVLEVIDSRKNAFTDDIYFDLVNFKYRLMCSLDTTYDSYLFTEYRKEDEIFCEDYSFVQEDIFSFIDEIFECTDKDMLDIDISCSNTIKGILIETYYFLTGDERVRGYIRNNPNYGKEHFITYLFENIMKKSKKKIIEKEDE